MSEENTDGPDPAELEAASDHLREAAGAADDDDLRERLETQAERLSDAADRERGPDHGSLARRTNVLRELGEEGGDAVAEHTDAAVERIGAYRENLPGV
ncbi:DUF7553 family protein [Candidatus Halobonum tyrrellensis]|uniref:Uncharacterized protein n=1 Tax=Candidatus Halobonum tyrrellensis G22 TaxID=1324957 RepID=V4HD03_9EURY|nr:hypothetical protein [Candidatus Halobonum tyrrellensis]ESP87943.1 hypothetical protein K933_11521 [Candidatus Halobonum tyrrellensis G22]